MRQPVTHIIHKVNLEIEASGERQARYLYGQAGIILQQHVLPRLEQWLQQYDTEGMHLRLESLDVTLQLEAGSTAGESIKTQLAAAIAAQLKQAMDKATEEGTEAGQQPEGKSVSDAQQVAEAFFTFLESGALPWWMADTSILTDSSRLIEKIAPQEATFIQALLRILKTRAGAMARLLKQFDALLLHYLYSLAAPAELLAAAGVPARKLSELSGEGAAAAQRLQLYWALVWQLFPLEELPDTPVAVYRQQLEKTLAQWPDRYFRSQPRIGKATPEETKEPGFLPGRNKENAPGAEGRLDNAADPKEREHKDHPELITDDALPEAVIDETSDKEAGEEQPVADGELWLANAGLVILHPFLQYFFLELGLLEGTAFKNKQARSKAVHLMHYLATGREQSPDFELVGEKYLCGMPPEQTTYRFTRLSTTMKQEADGLLSSVIRHWEALKNTSVAGLREGFLQRKGKLLIKDSQHKLLVERQAPDILLERLPWSLSLIKLPWLQQIIHVEWTL